MQSHLISVGFEIPGEAAECVDFSSDTSLLDADIVVFAPNLEGYTVDTSYQGKDLLTKHDSGRIQADSAHWNRELRIALEPGKTVFVVMLGTEALYIHTGQTNYSGTGRNARGTDIVGIFDPYSTVPVPGLEAAIQRRIGERIKMTKDIGLLSAYWKEFSSVSYYQAYLQEKIGIPALVTQTGDKMVGGMVRDHKQKGTVILLPYPYLSRMVEQREEGLADDHESSIESLAAESSEENPAPSEAEKSVGNQFTLALVEIHKTLTARAERTPAPVWAVAAEYDTKAEKELRAEVAELEAAIEQLQGRKFEAETKLDAAGNLRGLLFEKGKQLESAILEALRTVGFNADGFVDEESEFDAVWTDGSGMRLLGEAEGKDDRCINIDKLDQLARNIEEEYAKRPDSTEYAKGVLFGNAFRLLPLLERGDFFTPKCLAGAKRLGVALVRTPDLFVVARFVKESSNVAFAALCREAILNTIGRVVAFPELTTTPSVVRNPAF